jgi:hypothetical protein
MNDKVSFAQLVDWIEGQLSAAAAEQIAAKVAADQTAQADVTWIRTFHQVRDGLAWEAPPAEVRTQLSRRFAVHAAENRPPGLWQHLTAVLKFDSQMQPAAMRVRSSFLPTERQLVYSTAYADVALTIRSQKPVKSFSLFGQILPIGVEVKSSHSIQLLQGSQERAFVVAAEMGEFVFEKMPEGEYELAIQSDQYEIVIPLRLAV